MNTYTRDNFDDIVQAMKGTAPGTFFLIRGYSSETHEGEIADYWCQYGVNYGNLLRKDIAALEEIAQGRDISVGVEHGAWVDADGFEGLVPSPTSLVTPEPTSNSIYGTMTRTEMIGGFRSKITTEGFIKISSLKQHKANDRVYVRVAYLVTRPSGLLDKAVESMLASLRKRLESFGKQQKRLFQKECRGGYTLSYRRGRLYIRQALVVYKVVRSPAFVSDHQVSSPLVAVKNALEQQEKLRTAKLRSFLVCRDDKVSHNFESISLGGSVVLPPQDDWASVEALVNASADAQGAP